MKNTENDPNLQENNQNNPNTSQNQSSSPDTSSSPTKITLYLPNPQIYLSKAKNHLKNTTFIRKFLQKTLKSRIIFLFLLVFFIINVIFSVSNAKMKSDNIKLNEDMVTIYGLVEMINITRKVEVRQIKYLEDVLDRNDIYIDSSYRSTISDEVYEEYEETIKQLHKIDYNTVLDQYLNDNYNEQLYEKRKQEEKNAYKNE